MNIPTIRNYTLAVPPRSEQDAIVASIDEVTGRTTEALTDARLEIELLREYRTRLIADVVTGKLDVRVMAADLPDESGEPATLDEAEEDSAADDPAVDLDLVPEEAEA